MRSNVQPLFPSDEAPQEAVGARFEEFWRYYPRKVGKAVAKAKYIEIVRGCTTRTLQRDSQTFIGLELQATEEQLIQAVQKWVDSMIDKKTFKRTVEDKYLPHAETWLNKGRFEDFIDG